MRVVVGLQIAPPNQMGSEHFYFGECQCLGLQRYGERLNNPTRPLKILIKSCRGVGLKGLNGKPDSVVAHAK